MRERITATTLIVICCSVVLSAQAPRAAIDNDAINRAVVTFMRSSGSPGIAIAIQTSRGSFRKAYGTSDLENNVPVAPQTVFRFASITKAITATAVMQLVQAGNIDLD